MYAKTQSNGYHGYSTPSTNAKEIQVIEVSIPNNPLFNGAFGIKAEEGILSSVIKQYLSQTGSGSSIPYTFSIHAYNDKNVPLSTYANAHNLYGNQGTLNSQSQYSHVSAYQHPIYEQSTSQPPTSQLPTSQLPTSQLPTSQAYQPNIQQLNFAQQQQNSYDYNSYNQKQQQHQREVAIYEQKL